LSRRFLSQIVLGLMLTAAAAAKDRAPAPSATTHSPHGELAIPCQNCHSAAAWKPIRAIPEFDHNKTRYPLRGMHQDVACVQCHTKLVFTNVATACAYCHADIHRGQFGSGCEQCHTVKGWNVSIRSIRDHENRFPLLGAHGTLDCEACHKGAATGQYQGLSTQCYSCHAQVYARATNPNHALLGFPTTCDQCHSVDTWLNARFDHNAPSIGFPLTGAHTRVTCDQCHTAANPKPGSACASCHLRDYQSARNPSHIALNFSQNCALCHTTAAWSPATFDHNSVGFPLTGGHAHLQCTQCHTSNNFNLTTTACVSCHLNDFKHAVSPVNHAGFPTNCEQCHDTVSWMNARFDHSTTGFPLTGAHAAALCSQCHINNNYSLNSSNTLCFSCHSGDFNGATSPVNHTGFPNNCERCHDTVSWMDARFDHSTTGFALTGAHATTQCGQCHTNGNYKLTNTACMSCHASDWNKTSNPNHQAAGFSQDCSQCHTTVNWAGATFNHNGTGFPLTGAHGSLQCLQCHTGNNFGITSTACISCHLNDYNTANSPPHKTAGFPQDCTICHTTVQWMGAKFDHASTGFALTGAHTSLPCAQCHGNNNYAITVTTCVSCHINDYKNTNNPNHVQQGFGQNCESCHNTSAWDPALFDHSKSGFPLMGAHATAACTQCHVSNNFNITNTACVSCHQPDYDKALSPVNHKQLGFPLTCQDCHDTVLWTNGKFDHASRGFPLTGAHATLQCAQCHTNNNYGLTSIACMSCHASDWNKTSNPNHQAAGFSQDCSQCHTTVNWAGATFNHNSTGFQLTGAHATLQCLQCHTNNNFGLTSTACITCHLNDYSGANSPPHQTAGFPQDCTMCHTAVQWMGAKFDHTSKGFQLTGMHATIQCGQCHTNNNYSLTNTACMSCHASDWNKTSQPNHQAAGFPQDCSTCHTTVNWMGAIFNHNSTGFQLTGAHAALQCLQCHTNNNFGLTSTACITCHLNDYNGANSPPHKTAGFPRDCTMCHTTVQWMGAKFDHTTTGFTLTGTHATTQCSQCHTNNNYNLTSTACITCHLSDYNRAANHTTLGYPQDCTMCHSTSNWTSATFNHSTTGFTLTGTHATLQCVQCHTANNYGLKDPSCIACHQGDFAKATTPVPHVGFPTTCQMCHTTVAWTDASGFNHSNTAFPLTGAHVSVACANCHVLNNYTTLATDCYSCHKAVYRATTNPNHQASHFPITCENCHSTTSWLGAVFNHTWFNMNHGNAGGVCATCHTNPNDYSVFQCTVCHGGNNPANFHHPNVSGYVYNSVKCYQCHSRGGG
jgi:hypothetical protein